STDDSTAYIAFQENNAFGIFDLEDMELDSIVALGTKDYSQGCYDLSDRDGGVEFTCGQPVSSMYMPDAIALFNSGGNDYIVTANEGDGREYEGEPGYTDEVRGNDLTLNATYWSERGYDAAAQTELLLDENLGRLKVSIADGDHDGDGEHEEIVGYGARSMTIWDANGELVFDTGDQISHLTQTYGEYINGYTASRNDDKGAEPEGVTTGSYDGTDYAFLGLERAGGVMVYDLTNPSRAMFDQYITFPNHVSPEGLTFVDASDSPTNQPLLLVANEVSGTIAIISPVHQSVPSHAPGDDQPCLASDTGAHLAVDCGNQLNVMGDSDVHWTLVGQYDSGLGEGASEISAYDAGSHRSFVVNAVTGSIDILDMSNPTDPYLLHRLSITNGEPNSVDVHNGLVAVAVAGVGEEGSGMSKQDAGHVMFFDTDGNMVSTVIAGALPDMLTFTPDGAGVLVANEGEPNDDYTIDPEGTLTYVDLSGGDAAALSQANVTQINFNAFESQLTTLTQSGVRIFGPNANLSEDLEPEYIAMSPDGTHAMVVLQENNAFAKVDLSSLSVTSIVSMGMKDYSLGMYDFSDRDDGVNLQSYNNIFGMPMPDAISSYTVGGQTYYVTANEGDARDYDGYSEEVRLDDLDLDDTVFPNEADLLLDENLGRLKTTTTCGDTDGDGDLDFICSYGTRSFSIWDSNGALVWDSGDSISALMVSHGEYINGYTQSRNDDKGAEPEGVVVGEAFGKTYAFVGLERAGGILVYDVSDPTAPVFDQYIYLPDHVSPEGLDFISAADSPNGAAMLVVAHEVSGTVAILQPLV
ncbi:MAG: choice-of-anchor I family protein, partial [Candidatus Poseidonia sp.]|nr:choice-of-anchor I family protein [Poseidonia sp.]